MSDAVRQAAAGSAPMWDFAQSVDHLFYAMLAVSTLVTLLVAVLIVFFSIRYRQGRERDRVIRAQHRRYLEYFWIGIPLLIFMAFFWWGASIFLGYQELPKNALVIDGIAKQWMWKFYHPGGQREINELHVPVNRPVIVRLASEDVIHSFFVPNFRVKQDVVPGLYTHTWFIPRQTGSYHLFCAEFCGTDHAEMRGTVEVLTEQGYADWLDRQEHQPTLAQAGQRLFREQGCSGCHAAASAVHAPDLNGLIGRVVHLSNGQQIKADRAYVRDSIMLPEKQVVVGYKPIMPSFADQLSEEQVLKLVAYIESLNGEDPYLPAEPENTQPENAQPENMQ